jgi:hypothetical protein
MSDVPSSHLIGDAQSGRAWPRLCTERPLLLYDDNDAIACEKSSASCLAVWLQSLLTYACMLDLLSHDRDTLDNGCSGVVDAIEHRLYEKLASRRLVEVKRSRHLQLYHRGNILNLQR